MSTRHYEALTAPERFTLMIEAMARGDEVEADRLEDTCPRLTYRAEDAEFRDRMRRAYMITSMVALNMRAGLARIQMAQAFQVACSHFADPAVMLGQTAFLYGRAYGHWEAGNIDTIGLPDPPALAAEAEADPLLKQQMDELRELGGEVVRQVADTLHYAVGEAEAVNLLSQWQGFGRFCWDALGVEPLTLAMAFGVADRDPADEVRIAYPGVTATEDLVARSAARWTRSWNRRFEKRLYSAAGGPAVASASKRRT